jgi:hypothetical protein
MIAIWGNVSQAYIENERKNYKPQSNRKSFKIKLSFMEIAVVKIEIKVRLSGIFLRAQKP